MDLDKYLIPAEEGFIINALKKAHEKKLAKIKKENEERAAKEKVAVNVDEFYSRFHVTPGNREQLRTAMYLAIEKEIKKINSKYNNKAFLDKFFTNCIKYMKSQFDDEELFELTMEQDFDPEDMKTWKFSCIRDGESGFQIGEEFSQEAEIWIVSTYMEDYLIPEIKKNLPGISRVVNIYVGGDGDEGYLATNFKFI